MFVPSHLCQIDAPVRMGDIWSTFVPTRLNSTALRYRKQLWYVRPRDWSKLEAYIPVHEDLVRKNADSGGIGVLVYDLTDMQTDGWATNVIHIAQMHQRLHRNGSYDKWLVKTYIVVPNEIAHATVSMVLTTWRPTRPFAIVTSIEDANEYVRELWLPRNRTARPETMTGRTSNHSVTQSTS